MKALILINMMWLILKNSAVDDKWMEMFYEYKLTLIAYTKVK